MPRHLELIESCAKPLFLCRLRPTLSTKNSFPLYLFGLNKTLIHWDLSLQILEFFNSKHDSIVNSLLNIYEEKFGGMDYYLYFCNRIFYNETQ